MAGLFYQPEFVKVSFDIFGIRVSRQTSSRVDWPSKRSFYCKSILDFVEMRVCSLVYNSEVSQKKSIEDVIVIAR
jgi:hypothetical protein